MAQTQEIAQSGIDFDAREEYRTIEATLLESTRGRWFLAEHGRRARRLDSALLEDAIGKLQKSIRQPPALLGQLQTEVEAIRATIISSREELTQRAAQAASAEQSSVKTSADGATATSPAANDAEPLNKMLQAAEDIHEQTWNLQAKDLNPDACEAIARQASSLYALSMHQAAHSSRILKLIDALDETSARVEGVLQTITHELQIDAVSDDDNT